MHIKTLIEKFNYYIIFNEHVKIEYELNIIKEIRSNVFIVNVYNRYTHQYYFNYEITVIKNSIIMIKSKFTTSSLILFRVDSVEINLLITETTNIINEINSIYNIIKKNIPTLKKYKRFGTFYFNKYYIIIGDNYSFELKNMYDDNRTTLLFNKKFICITELLDFIKIHKLHKKHRKLFCCYN
jgi:hypothetical protein